MYDDICNTVNHFAQGREEQSWHQARQIVLESKLSVVSQSNANIQLPPDTNVRLQTS